MQKRFLRLSGKMTTGDLQKLFEMSFIHRANTKTHIREHS